MKTLNLFEKRKYHEVILDIEGEPKTFKLPHYFTTYEVERILEVQAKIDEYNEKHKDVLENIKDSEFLDLLYERIAIMFHRYQPEYDAEFYKKHLTVEEVIEITTFHIEQQATTSIEEVGLENHTESNSKK